VLLPRKSESEQNETALIKSTPAFQCLPNPKQGHVGYGFQSGNVHANQMPNIPIRQSIFHQDSVLQLGVWGFAAQHPRAVIFICAGRTPAESPAKSISNATRMRSSHETLKNANGGAGAEIFFAPNQWTIRAAPLPPIRACTDAP
jgi:hypothetical protein